METPVVQHAPADPLVALQGLVRRLGETLSRARTVEVLLGEAVAVCRARAVQIVLVQSDGRLLTHEGKEPSAAVHEAAAAAVAGRFPRETAPLVALPLVARNRVLGALVLEAPAEASRSFLELVATQAALALDRAFLHEDETLHREALEASETRFRSLVQELDAVFWECDPVTFQFDFVSKRAERLLGYPVARWLEPGFWASILHPEDRHWALDFCVECTRDGQDHAFEYRMNAADGRALWFRDVVYVIRDAQGRPSKLRGVMLDITHERQARPEVRVAKRIRPPA